MTTTAPNAPDRLLRDVEVAEMLGCGRSFVWGLIIKGELQSVHIGRLRRVPASSVAAYIGEKLAAGSGQG